uniref:Secreted protein n=1 Tax=Trichogramma kaykai TaxID=54128 RepID=A0ABD2WLX3_9HYME
MMYSTFLFITCALLYIFSSNATRQNGSRTHRPAAAQRAAASSNTHAYVVLCTCALLTSRSTCRIDFQRELKIRKTRIIFD